MSSLVNHLGGRCPHIPFSTGGQMSEGGNVRLPQRVPDPICLKSYKRIVHIHFKFRGLKY